MTGITHTQAGRYMRKALDGLLTDAQRRDLQTHLDECAACRLESESFSLLTAHLKTEFQARWDTQHGPSTNVMANVQSQTRRIIMKKRIDFAFNLLGGAAALLVLFFVVTTVISQFQKKSTPATNETQTNGSNPVSEQAHSIATDKFNGEWIAFIGKIQNSTALGESQDVFMIHPDGSGLTKLTSSENPVNYYNLQWSPDGKNLLVLREHDGKIDILRTSQYGGEVLTRPITDPDHYGGFSWSPNSDKIVFVDSTNGNYEIYTMYADGRNDPQLRQLTNDPANDVGFVWSPDGSQIAFERLGGDQLSVYVMNEDGSNQREVARGMGKVKLRWSLDGKSIYASSTENSRLECEACVAKPAIYHISLAGQSVRQIYVEPAASKVDGWYLYDTPQNSVFFARIEQSGFLNFQGNWMQFDGNSVRELGSSDPHQTCKTTTGNILGEHISPNERFSIITDACAGSFDLYLADREATTPEQKLSHLIKLPLSTYGQGGDDAYLPMNWSPDGRWLIYDDGNQSINLLNLEKTIQDPATEPSTLFHSESNTFMPSEFAWQPAVANQVVEQKPIPEPTQPQSLIAFVMTQDYVNGEIYTMKPDGSDLTNITNNPATEESPAWSPDGKQIAFVSDRSGGRDIYIMNADGSNVKKLTDSTTFNDNFAWSPDGTKIAYLSDENPLHQVNQLMVMDTDGSNKIALTSEPGRYTFLGWSPDGQNIVYQATNLGDTKDSRIMSASVDGKSTLDGPFFEGDSGRSYSQIHWETPEQFIALGVNSEQSTWGPWNLTRFFTTGDYTNYNGSNPILITSNSPIVAVFDKSYVVEDQNSLTWFVYDGAPIPFAPWKFSEICSTSTEPLLAETTHTISPDKQQDFVRLQCPEGTTYFYLMNSDGTKIQQLGESLAKPSQATDMEWSSDGNHVLVTVASNKGTELYRFDIQEMLNNPTMQPIQLATDSVMIYGAVWQPIVNNDVVEEKPTTEPFTFMLTINEAETLAGFDVLEPAYIPAGYTLEGVAYDPQTQKVAMKYVTQENEGVLFIYQQRGDFVNDPAVQAYVTPVPIGNMQAEYVQGAWIYDTSTTTTPRWDASATTYSLTWQKDAITYSIDFIGGETVTPLLLSEFVAIAESLK